MVHHAVREHPQGNLNLVHFKSKVSSPADGMLQNPEPETPHMQYSQHLEMRPNRRRCWHHHQYNNWRLRWQILGVLLATLFFV